MEIVKANHGQLIPLYLQKQGIFLTKVEQITDISQIYANGREPVTIGEFVGHNPEITAAMLLKLIGDTLVWYGSETDITDEAGKMLVRRIVQTFPYLSFEDISLALKMKSAEHKFGKLNVADIYSWIRDYDFYRMDQVDSFQVEKPLEISQKAISREEYEQMKLEELCPRCEIGNDAYKECKLMHMFNEKLKITNAYIDYKKHRFDKRIKEEEKQYEHWRNSHG